MVCDNTRNELSIDTMDTEQLISDFTKLFSSLKSVQTEDQFLLKTLDQQLQRLLKNFIYFNISSQDQQRQSILFQLANVSTTLSIFRQLDKITNLTYMKAERDILLFRRSLSKFKPLTKKTTNVVIHQPLFKSRKITNSFNPTKKKILGFINKDSDTLNSDVFSHFKDLSKRTLKRHLSDLIEMGYIQRESEGKKVYYKKLNKEVESSADNQQYS